MKNSITRLLFAAAVITTLSSCGVTSYMVSDDQDYYYQRQSYHQGVDFNMFYQQLSPFGNWINYPGIGQVWVTNERNFRPYYSNGHWAYTNFGWTWVSNYSWGWAPFHYGRWGFDPFYGWFWVPGYDWAPAWVNWRGNGSFYGWAPMGPGGRFNNMNMHNNWVFVNNQHITSNNLLNHVEPIERNAQILSNSNEIRTSRTLGNTRYTTGPDRAEVERVTRQPIRPLQVEQLDRPDVSTIENNRVRIYRPGSESIRTERPAREMPVDEVRENRRNNWPSENEMRRRQEVFERPAEREFPSAERERTNRQMRDPGTFERGNDPRMQQRQGAQGGWGRPSMESREPAPVMERRQPIERREAPAMERRQPIERRETPAMERREMMPRMERETRMERREIQQPAERTFPGSGMTTPSMRPSANRPGVAAEIEQ